MQSVRAYQQRTFADTPKNTCIRFGDRVKWASNTSAENGGIYLGSKPETLLSGPESNLRRPGTLRHLSRQFVLLPTTLTTGAAVTS